MFNWARAVEGIANPSSGACAIDDLRTPSSVGRAIFEGKYRNVICMVGAGVSVAAGIPDFRSDDGLYGKLKGMGYEDPTVVFTLDWFNENRGTFYRLMNKYIPTNAQPTDAHRFLKCLHDRGILTRVYTQNIDGLEHRCGLPDEKIVAVHGTSATVTCTQCGLKDRMTADGSIPMCSACLKIVRPDIVFFGEPVNLPAAVMKQDFASCDLLLIMGTSLTVFPFARLVAEVKSKVPRIFVNKRPPEWPTNDYSPRRDATLLGDVQEICRTMASVIEGAADQ